MWKLLSCSVKNVYSSHRDLRKWCLLRPFSSTILRFFYFLLVFLDRKTNCIFLSYNETWILCCDYRSCNAVAARYQLVKISYTLAFTVVISTKVQVAISSWRNKDFPWSVKEFRKYHFHCFDCRYTFVMRGRVAKTIPSTKERVTKF